MTTKTNHNGIRTLLIALLFMTSLYGHAARQDTTSVIQQMLANSMSSLDIIEEPQSKVITNAKMIGIGHTNILDTYLSPERYTGTELVFISQTTRARQDRKWSRQIVHQGEMSLAHTRQGDAKEIAGNYNFRYAWHYNWHLLNGKLDLKAGIETSLNLGFIYNTLGGNNPAQARASLDIEPSGAATYHFTIKNRPLALRYELEIPMAGIMFSPQYGQSYYELFSRGNYDNNAVSTYPGNAPSMLNYLTLDFQIGNTTLRAGYMGEFRQAKVNNLKNHIYTHAFMIGFVKHFKLINTRP